MKWFTAWRRRPWRATPSCWPRSRSSASPTPVLRRALTAPRRPTPGAGAGRGQGQGAVRPGTAPAATALNARGHQDRAEPDRRRRRLGRLPGRHRPDARREPGRADPAQEAGSSTPSRRRELAAYVASLGGGPAIPSGDQVDPAARRRRARRRAVPRQLRAVPQLRRLGWRADRRQVRPVARQGDAHADLRGHDHRPAGDAGLQRHDDHARRRSARSSPTSPQTRERAQPRRQRPRPRRPGGRGPGGWLVGIGLMVVAAMWITAKKPKKKLPND